MAEVDTAQLPPDQYQRLINAYLDDSISVVEFEELSDWITVSSTNAQWFARMAAMHSAIRSNFQRQDLSEFLSANDSNDHLELGVDPQNIIEMLSEFDQAEQRRADVDAEARLKQVQAEAEAKRLQHLEDERLNRPSRPQPIEIPRSLLWIAIAICVIVAAFVAESLFIGNSKQPDLVEVAPPVEVRRLETIVTVTKSIAAVWSGENSPQGPGGRLPVGPIALVEGAAELAFDDSACVVIEAPVQLELMSAGRLRLERGNVVAKVPAEAIGFTISTAAGSIVDLGTEFGVGVDEAGDTRVQVIKGVVALATKTTPDAPRFTITAGSARHMQAESQEIAEIDFDGHAFLRNVPKSAYELAIMRNRPLSYWRFDSRDGVVRSLGSDESTGTLGSGISMLDITSGSKLGAGIAEFSSDNHGIVVTGVTAQEPLTRNFSLEAWVKPSQIQDSTGAMRIVSNFSKDSSGSSGWAFGVADERFIGGDDPRRAMLFTIHGVYDAISTKQVPMDEWVHLAVTVDSRGCPAMYINGAEVIEFSREESSSTASFEPQPEDADYSSGIRVSQNPPVIGRHPETKNENTPPEAWNGAIDELAVFDRVLTSEEIEEHYKASWK